MRRFFKAPSAVLSILLALAAVSPALAELSVVIGYDTRAIGEIDPCG